MRATRSAVRMAALAVTLALPAAAWPGDAGPYAGQWTGTMTTQAGGKISVDLVLKGSGGTWRMAAPQGTARAKVNPCLERDFPVVVIAQSEGSIQFDIQGGQQIQGCIDQRATLAASEDGRKLHGRLDDGRAVSFSRR